MQSTSTLNSLRGQLLISAGGLMDPDFRHTVVLVGEHGPEGALGIVLNRPLDLTVEDAIPELQRFVESGTPVFQGGPVQPESPVLLAEFTSPTEAHLPVFGLVGFLVGDVPVDATEDIQRARVFAGYAGWGPGQLEAEIAEGSWIVDPAREDDVFTNAPELLWSRVLRRKGPEYDGLSKMPYDPSMN